MRVIIIGALSALIVAVAACGGDSSDTTKRAAASSAPAANGKAGDQAGDQVAYVALLDRMVARADRLVQLSKRGVDQAAAYDVGGVCVTAVKMNAVVDAGTRDINHLDVHGDAREEIAQVWDPVVEQNDVVQSAASDIGC